MIVSLSFFLYPRRMSHQIIGLASFAAAASLNRRFVRKWVRVNIMFNPSHESTTKNKKENFYIFSILTLTHIHLSFESSLSLSVSMLSWEYNCFFSHSHTHTHMPMYCCRYTRGAQKFSPDPIFHPLTYDSAHSSIDPWLNERRRAAAVRCEDQWVALKKAPALMGFENYRLNRKTQLSSGVKSERGKKVKSLATLHLFAFFNNVNTH